MALSLQSLVIRRVMGAISGSIEMIGASPRGTGSHKPHDLGHASMILPARSGWLQYWTSCEHEAGLPPILMPVSSASLQGFGHASQVFGQFSRIFGPKWL
jgi:hypothetical protein